MTLPSLEISGGDDWFRAVPPSAVPVPAAMLSDLHRQRAIAAFDGVGLLHDLRILGDAHHEAHGTSVDVVPELDYWRTRFSPATPVAARRLPIDQVWVEHRLDYQRPAEPGQEPPSSAGAPAALLRRIAPGPSQPGARTPVPARTVGHLHGRRVIQSTPTGWAWDLRAVSEPYQNEEGEITLNATSANDYYRWIITGTLPEAIPLPLYLLWTE
ncbi:hypothetical protein [Streptomyces sp. NPDC037389]|uniref:hypothetical protein n=1 Tax=Streptomyces sp. NPDC037389 TaxID=3155369 RepID=UPI0033C0D82A